MLTRLSGKFYSLFVTLIPLLLAGFAFLPVSTHAQDLPMTLDQAPDMLVDLLRPNSSLNQDQIACQDSQPFPISFLEEDALLLMEARCRKILLDGAAYNIQKSPLAQTLNPEATDLNSQNLAQIHRLAQSLVTIKIVAYEYMMNETGDHFQDENGDNILTTRVDLRALYPNLSEALKDGVMDFKYQTLLGLALDREAQALEKIEKKIAEAFLKGKGKSIPLREEFNILKAMQLFRQCLTPPNRTSPSSPNQSKTTQGEQLMKRAIKLDPSSPLVFYMLGENQLKLANLAQATISFTQALKLSPELAPALIGRGTAYLSLNLLDLALADFNNALKINAEQPSYYMARASVWLINKDYKAMCKDFELACSMGECDGYLWADSRKLCD